jgi:hypothetical protein
MSRYDDVCYNPQIDRETQVGFNPGLFSHQGRLSQKQPKQKGLKHDSSGKLPV